MSSQIFGTIGENEEIHENVIKLFNFPIGLHSLLKGFTVQLPIVQGKIFLSILSSFYGYETARARWQWETNEDKTEMIFNKRLTPRRK